MKTESIDLLAKLSSQLNQETESLNDDIKHLEKALDKMKVGVSVWLDTEDDRIEVPEADGGNCGPDGAGGGSKKKTPYRIGYTKVKDKWRIAAQRTQDPAETVALTKAPRLVRVHALPKLETLVAKLTARVQEFLDQVLEVKKALEPEPEPEPVEAPAEPPLTVEARTPEPETQV